MAQDDEALQPVYEMVLPTKKRRNYGGRPRGKVSIAKFQQLAAAEPASLDSDDWKLLEKGRKESVLKAQCLKEILKHHPSCLVFQHQDHGTAGIPDWSVTCGGRTIWLEFKYADPVLVSRGIQELTCLKLETEGSNCYYVIYFEMPNCKETLICLPSRVYRGTWLMEFVGKADGFDHKLIAAFLGVSTT